MGRRCARSAAPAWPTVTSHQRLRHRQERLPSTTLAIDNPAVDLTMIDKLLVDRPSGFDRWTSLKPTRRLVDRHGSHRPMVKRERGCGSAARMHGLVLAALSTSDTSALMMCQVAFRPNPRGGNVHERSSNRAVGSARARGARRSGPGTEMGWQLGSFAAAAEPGCRAVSRDAELQRSDGAPDRALERRRLARAPAAHERVRHEAGHDRRGARHARRRHRAGQGGHRESRDVRRPPIGDDSGRRAARERPDRPQRARSRDAVREPVPQRRDRPVHLPRDGHARRVRRARRPHPGRLRARADHADARVLVGRRGARAERASHRGARRLDQRRRRLDAEREPPLAGSFRASGSARASRARVSAS